MTEHYSPFAVSPFILIAAFLLDAAIGDPVRLPHPVRIIGWAISKIESLIRKCFGLRAEERKRERAEERKLSRKEKIGGVILVIFIVSLTYLVTFLFIKLTYYLPYYFHLIVLIFLTSTVIAAKELIKSAKLVIESVKHGDIEAARKALSMIVGRDTNNLSDKQILRANAESLSENLSDGVVAPLFYLVIGGLPLAMTYKAINTMDSMVGYKNKRYINFGWAAARLDDLANYIPARISGVLIMISTLFAELFKCPSYALRITHHALLIMLRDGRKHPSPNSGIPEAAMAGAIGIKMGGPSTYSEVVIEKPYIGEDRTDNYLTASEKAIGIAVTSFVLSAVVAVTILFLRNTT